MSTVDRPKYVLVQYGTVIAVGLVLAGVIALGGAWTAAQPTQTTERVSVYQETVSTGVDTSAVVTGNTTLYNESEELRDMPVYLFRATPTLNLTVNTSLDADRRANVTHRLALRFRAAREGDTFWQNTTTYVNETRRTSNGSVTSAATVDVPAVRERAQRFRSEIGSAGTFSVAFVLEVTYRVRESPIYENTLRTSAPLVMDSESYRIGGDLAASRTEEASQRRTTTVPALIDSMRSWASSSTVHPPRSRGASPVFSKTTRPLPAISRSVAAPCSVKVLLAPSRNISLS